MLCVASCPQWVEQGAFLGAAREPLGRASNLGTGETQQGWSSSSFAVKRWAPLLLKVSCKMHEREQMHGLQVTLW